MAAAVEELYHTELCSPGRFYRSKELPTQCLVSSSPGNRSACAHQPGRGRLPACLSALALILLADPRRLPHAQGPEATLEVNGGYCVINTDLRIICRQPFVRLVKTSGVCTIKHHTASVVVVRCPAGQPASDLCAHGGRRIQSLGCRLARQPGEEVACRRLPLTTD